jgi:hypothetical protein
MSKEIERGERTNPLEKKFKERIKDQVPDE